jgi:hypothetical protein
MVIAAPLVKNAFLLQNKTKQNKTKIKPQKLKLKKSPKPTSKHTSKQQANKNKQASKQTKTNKTGIHSYKDLHLSLTLNLLINMSRFMSVACGVIIAL